MLNLNYYASLYRKSILLCLLVVLLLGTSHVKAQHELEPVRKHTIFLELGGNGGFYSINYDRIMLTKESWKLAGRAGAMFYRSESDHLQSKSSTWFAVPLEVSYLRGRSNHLLELGVGVTPLYHAYATLESSHVKEVRLLPVARIGYRYQRNEGGMFYKAGFTPMAQFDKEENSNQSCVLPWFGLAIGYTLKK